MGLMQSNISKDACNMKAKPTEASEIIPPTADRRPIPAAHACRKPNQVALMSEGKLIGPGAILNPKHAGTK